MQLINKRPIILPSWKSGKWYDDFTVTGAKDPGYILSGLKTVTTNGIIIYPPGVGGCDVEVSPKYCSSNFIIETMCRIITGSLITPANFRKTDWDNRWRVEITSGNVLRLQKTVLGATTLKGTVNITSALSWNLVRIEALGANIDVYHNGVLKISVNDPDLLNNKRIHFSMYDVAISQPKGEYQYFAIKPI